MSWEKISVGFLISTAVVLLFAKYTLSNAVPTLEARNVSVTTEAANAKKGVEIATTEITKQHNDHQENSTDTHTLNTARNHSSEGYFNKELQDFANNEVAVFANKHLSSFKKFADNVIAVAAGYDGVDKEQMRLELETFKEFYADMKGLEESFDTSYSFGLLEYVAGVFYLLDLTGDFACDPCYESNFIDNFLRRHNFESLVSEFHVDAKSFKRTLKSKVYEFWQKLPTEERGSEEDFEKWYADFSNYRSISSFTFTDDL